MVANRVGDVAIAIAMYIMYQTFGTLEFSTIFAIIPKFAEGIGSEIIIGGVTLDTYTIIGILILIGAAGKSAQVGLHI